MTAGELADVLRRAGFAGEPTLQPLTGGVSSDVWLVELPGRPPLVVKRALEKLRVAADWRADTARNITERRFLEYVAGICPGGVPEVIFADEGAGLFGMEYLDGFANWKEDLLRGSFDEAIARQAGKLLGEIHARSRGDERARREFDTGAAFEDLRIAPYLRATAAAHPDLAGAILEEAERLAATRECLVHGDYSPKNMLHRDGRLVVVDCEVAWFGDPAFDAAFLINHLCLKALYHAPRAMPPMVQTFRDAYRAAFGGHADAVEQRTARLLPMLMLARVDGKSPVEYLDPRRQALVRRVAGSFIAQPPPNLDTVTARWAAQCAQWAP